MSDYLTVTPPRQVSYHLDLNRIDPLYNVGINLTEQQAYDLYWELRDALLESGAIQS